VAVTIQGHEYRIRSDGDDEAIERVAQYVDRTMGRVRQRTRTVDSRDVAVLAALNIARELLALREGRAPARPGADHLVVEARRVHELLDLLDAAEGA
jgi:cell division protein ZapA